MKLYAVVAFGSALIIGGFLVWNYLRSIGGFVPDEEEGLFREFADDEDDLPRPM
jgi:hypothetical protein